MPTTSLPAESPSAARLTIGQLADAAGVNIETIRYYQRCGLMDEPPRPLSGHRRYGQEQIQRLRFIKRAQALGFSLAEIGGLLRLDDACACTETRTLAAQKLALIGRKMADLGAMQQALSRLVQACDAADAGAACPIISVLAAE